MSSLLDVNASNWDQQVLQADLLTVVDFWHEHCGWCMRYIPILNEVAEEYRSRVKFVKMNVFTDPENKKLALQYGVMGTPTLVLFCSGKPIEHLVGYMDKEKLKKQLDDLLGRYQECARQSTELKP